MKNYKHELIGETITVIESKNHCTINLTGMVIDETKNTIRIQIADQEKTIMKNNTTISAQNRIIRGHEIQGRPEERIK